jgi:hypothetical protein
MRFRVRTTDQRALALDRILGAGGRELLCNTLRSLTSGEARLDVAAEAAAQLTWQRVSSAPDQPDRFCLELASAQLPASLRSRGVDRLQIDLGIGPSVAMVKEHIHMTGASREVPEDVRREAQRLVNQSVNRVLALAVAQTLAHKLAAYVRQPVEQAVQVRVSQTCDVRAYAHVRG